MTSKARYPDGGGNEPGRGGDRRRRRRGSLAVGGEAAPLSPGAAAAGAGDSGDLTMTKREALPDPKVWGLRVSEAHYRTARMMMQVLGARYGLDQRQVGELIVQFLVERRHDLDAYVASQAGPAIDLEFFSRPGVGRDAGPGPGGEGEQELDRDPDPDPDPDPEE